MKANKYCQSCGMPMKQDPQGGGLNADGTKNQMYCSYCYVDGKFHQPDMTVTEMQVFVKEKMKEMGFPGFLAGFFTKIYCISGRGLVNKVLLQMGRLAYKLGVKFFCTIGAYAVAKLGFGSILNVLLYPLPEALIISNVVATGADWDEALQGVYLCQRKF